jgi:hypothetical protein
MASLQKESLDPIGPKLMRGCAAFQKMAASESILSSVRLFESPRRFSLARRGTTSGSINDRLRIPEIGS